MLCSASSNILAQKQQLIFYLLTCGMLVIECYISYLTVLCFLGLIFWFLCLSDEFLIEMYQNC
jgi:hypothetical protein